MAWVSPWTPQLLASWREPGQGLSRQPCSFNGELFHSAHSPAWICPGPSSALPARPQTCAGESGMDKATFLGDGREPHHTDRSRAEPPVPKPGSRPGAILFTNSNTGIPSIPCGACLCVQRGRSAPGSLPLPSTLLPPSPRSILS